MVILVGFLSECTSLLKKGLREKLATAFHDDGIDNARALELKKELAEEFRAQLASRFTEQ